MTTSVICDELHYKAVGLLWCQIKDPYCNWESGHYLSVSLFYKQLCNAPFVKRNGTLSLTHIEDLIGAYKPAACGSSNSTGLTWDTVQAAADPQPAGQAVHLDDLTSCPKAISNSKPPLPIFEILHELYEIWLKEKVQYCVFIRGVSFVRASNGQKGLNLIIFMCLKTERERTYLWVC